MLYEGKKLYLKQGNNTYTGNLYTSTDDFYSGVGLPIQLTNGTVVYAPLVKTNDYYAIPLNVQLGGGTWKVGTNAVTKVQQLDKVTTLEEHLSGNKEQDFIYGTVVFTVPYSGTVKLYSLCDCYHIPIGTSSDRWMWTYISIYLDGQDSYLNRLDLRKSNGSRKVRTLLDKSLTLSSGTHSLKVIMHMKCSSKDDNYSGIFSWKTTVTIQ